LLSERYKDSARYLELAQPIASFDGEFRFERQDSCADDQVRLLFVGSLTGRKGILDLVGAVAKAQRQLPDSKVLHLTLVGEEHHHESITIDDIMAYAHKLGIGKQVKCTGRIDDQKRLAGYYRRADMFIITSWSEGFPRVINEALLNSLPVIATPVGGIAAELTDGKQVLLVPPGDQDAIAAAIREIVSIPALRQTLIRYGYQWALEHMAEPAWVQHGRLLGLL
jgi:glycosyltransferase involved in cell wall biosynthesis